ncbi:succinate dehydrogenase, cytochrome b556 subunit [Basilea psittacipulmonis]|uniref:Succinate dehydrogenase cytochrome b556 subunit n=1 Tax=Basilea psittacipulmonis DSM 24701 TaxID=1072685 RepID=A0A077DDH7_9BURK|nr:succinate dehydrogenase, cytochrome b556 subunit [Basilea psittacipulmonis]AIL32206.1 succinate dehydrogenase [Basilea psittacipulmonis DSM 24701]
MQEYISKPRDYKYRNIGIQNITKDYRLPLAGQVSILHRISGVLLFLSLPVLVWLFSASLNQESFVHVSSGMLGFLLALICSVAVWGFFHHFCAGIRFLLLDLHIGLGKKQAAKSALLVFIISLSLTVVYAFKFFLYWGGYA